MLIFEYIYIYLCVCVYVCMYGQQALVEAGVAGALQSCLKDSDIEVKEAAVAALGSIARHTPGVCMWTFG